MIEGFKDTDLLLHAPRIVNARAARHAVFIKTLKLVFPLVVVAIIAVLISYISANKQGYIPQKEDAVVGGGVNTDKTAPGQIELLGAKYEGVDEEGRSYTITADKANRVDNGEDRVSFEKPVTDIFLDDATWLAVKSEGGVFNRVLEKMIMEKSVKAFHDSGYEVDLENIEIDMKTRSASTSSPVRVQGPIGSVSAAGMDVLGGGEQVILRGPVEAMIFDLSFLKNKKKGKVE